MKATIEKPMNNGKNLSGDKELIQAWSFVVPTRNGIVEPVVVRWWESRRADGSGRVYCSVWISGRDVNAAGHGYAGGYGYHKQSTALQSAIESAGFRLSEPIYGAGRPAMREAGEAICRALGYTGHPYIVTHG